MEISFDAPAIEKLKRSFRLALLLDGLNELGDMTDEFLHALGLFVGESDNTRTVVTSRTHNFQFGKHDLPVLELLQLTYPDDVNEFISGYVDDAREVHRIMSVLDKHVQIRNLAVNPLMLYMIILLNWHKKIIPTSRGQLFEQIASGLLGEWQLERGESPRADFCMEDKRLLLGHIGFAMQTEGLELTEKRVNEILKCAISSEQQHLREQSSLHSSQYRSLMGIGAIEAFVDEIVHDRILELPRDSGRLRFWHQTMQEYFSAQRIRAILAPLLRGTSQQESPDVHGRREALVMLRRVARDSCWHETLAVLAGILPVKESDRLLDEIWPLNTRLAAMCIGSMDKDCLEDRAEKHVVKLTRRLRFWCLYLPRLLPWTLLGGIVVFTWALPLSFVDQLTLLVQRLLPIPALVDGLYVIICVVPGAVAVMVFFRVYAGCVDLFEKFTNERIIRPALAALDHIGSSHSLEVIARLKRDARYDFAIGPLPARTQNQLSRT